MKILAYSHNSFPTVGGIATYCDTLCGALAKTGEEVTLLAPGTPEPAGCPYSLLEMSELLMHDRISLAGYISATQSLRRALRQLQPDVLWCCNLDALYVVALSRIAAPVAVTLHGSEIAKNFAKRDPVRWIRAKLIERALVRADRIIAVSRHTRSLAVRHLPQLAEKIDVVHNGRDILPAKLLFPPRQAGAGLTLLSVGRFVEFKGFHLFAEILAQLRQRFVNIKWLLAGDGDYRSAIIDAVNRFGLQDHVTLLGWIKPEPLGNLYRCADLLVHPAITDREGRDESFGLILVEAMLHGCPVAATGAGGTAEIVEDGISGIIFDVGRPAEAAEKLAGYLGDAARLRELGGRGQKHAHDCFSHRLCAANTLESLGKARNHYGAGGKGPATLGRKVRHG